MWAEGSSAAAQGQVLRVESMRRTLTLLIALVLVGGAAACGDDSGGTNVAAGDGTTSTTAGDGSTTTTYDPQIDPADFSDPGENQYFPLTPGTRWVYEGPGETGTEHNTVTVTEQTKEIMGVETLMIRD